MFVELRAIGQIKTSELTAQIAGYKHSTRHSADKKTSLNEARESKGLR